MIAWLTADGLTRKLFAAAVKLRFSATRRNSDSPESGSSIVEPGAFRTSLFGSRFRHVPALDAYAATVGAVRAWVVESDAEQPGDPRKAARAIVGTVDAADPASMPLRLPLGADAVAGIREKLAAIAADVDSTEAVAVATARSA